MKKLLIFFSTICFAIMPPSHYEKQIKKSQIKAEAKILQVKILDKTEYKIKKEITFELIKSKGKKTPQKIFKGWCYSVGKKPLVGGDKYYYPIKGERVYVTLFNGMVTSLKTLQDNTQNSFKKVDFRF